MTHTRDILYHLLVTCTKINTVLEIGKANTSTPRTVCLKMEETLVALFGFQGPIHQEAEQ